MIFPSYADYATHDESQFPELWSGCVGAWAPCLGASGTRLFDLSGRQNWGTLTNMDAATDWVVSGGQMALDFDGINDRVECDAIQSFAGDCSWLCWFRHTATGSDQCLVTTRNILTGASRNGLALYVRGGGFTNVEAEFVVNGNRFTATVNGATQDNTWRLAVARRIAGRTHLTVTGIGSATSSGTSTSAIAHEVGPTFGLWRDYATGAFAVQIDDIRFYNRAISQGEIDILASQRGIAYRRRKRRHAAIVGQQFQAAWFRQQQLIGSGVY